MSVPPLDPRRLQEVSARTLAHYRRFAADYRAGTWEHDVSQNIDALLGAIRRAPPCRILDLGCGPGRDLVGFRARGHEAVGLDGCPEFAEMARVASGCEVWLQDLLALRMPAGHFDGVFANAVLFHVPSQALPRVLDQLRATLRPDGVLLSSNPRGRNEEGWADGRYACFYDFATWRRGMEDAGFGLIDHYYRPPGRPRPQQPWLATLWRKRSAGCAGGSSAPDPGSG
ncbi:MAG TPA: class I SAM-dependent methyltransferase [Geminicoccaceae bacterium]|nr:class I SAM-dependent methyltransferase [Geminicoccaceae bacterium]